MARVRVLSLLARIGITPLVSGIDVDTTAGTCDCNCDGLLAAATITLLGTEADTIDDVTLPDRERTP